MLHTFLSVVLYLTKRGTLEQSVAESLQVWLCQYCGALAVKKQNAKKKKGTPANSVRQTCTAIVGGVATRSTRKL